ncbi:DUF397 domain-containing protein [Streptomyces pactum]|uniref:DUF397 domain-containing protein n=1 Tax=Streptomyces pactum TaxID=68249 RepID=UPI0037012D17
MSADLYTLPLTGITFRAMCGGNTGSSDNDESCLTIARIPGAADAFALGDTKNPGAAGSLRMTGDELDAFARAWAARRGLTL